MIGDTMYCTPEVAAKMRAWIGAQNAVMKNLRANEEALFFGGLDTVGSRGSTSAFTMKNLLDVTAGLKYKGWA